MKLPYTREHLIAQHDAGEQFLYTFFWGHRPAKQLTASCFSQWWQAAFEVDGVTFATAEHWMMYQKAITFGDEQHAQLILDADTPELAKRLGRKVANYDDNTWAACRYELVKQGNLHKFTQHADLRGFLLSTANTIIVEASPYDRIWGIGLEAKTPDIENPHTWKGDNLLGFALMEVRDYFRPA